MENFDGSFNTCGVKTMKKSERTVFQIEEKQMQKGRSLVCSRRRKEVHMAKVEVGRQREEFKG